MRTLEETRPTGHGRARGLVSSRVSGARIDAGTFVPPEDLADVVESFWYGRWDLQADVPHVTRLLGDPCVHICFEHAAPAVAFPSRLVGPWTGLWVRTLAGRGLVRAAKLHAGAAGAFLADASRVRDRILDLDAVFGGSPDGVLQQDATAGFSLLAEQLRRWRRPSPDTALAVAICARIKATSDLFRVEQLADLTGLSVRELQRLFAAHVGVTPKFALRRHRLQEIALRLERGEVANLAELAFELGYADQAHLARDFKGAVQVSATTFARDVHR